MTPEPDLLAWAALHMALRAIAAAIAGNLDAAELHEVVTVAGDEWDVRVSYFRAQGDLVRLDMRPADAEPTVNFLTGAAYYAEARSFVAPAAWIRAAGQSSANPGRYMRPPVAR